MGNHRSILTNVGHHSPILANMGNHEVILANNGQRGSLWANISKCRAPMALGPYWPVWVTMGQYCSIRIIMVQYGQSLAATGPYWPIKVHWPVWVIMGQYLPLKAIVWSISSPRLSIFANILLRIFVRTLAFFFSRECLKMDFYHSVNFTCVRTKIRR